MIQQIFSSQLRINVASGTVLAGINMCVLLVSYPFFLRFLGQEKYGVWLVLTTILGFAQMGELGIGQAVIKLVAEEYGRKNIRGIQEYIATALALLLFSGVSILIIILFFKDKIISAFNLSGEHAEIVSMLLPYIGALSIYVLLVQALNAVLTGLGRMDLAGFFQTIGRVVTVLVAIILLYRGWGMKGLLAGNVISYILIHVLSVIYIRRVINIHFSIIKYMRFRCCKRLLCFGGGVFGSSLIGMMFDPINKLILSRYVGVSSLPVYQIATIGAMQIKHFVAAGLQALMPEISRLDSEKSLQTHNRISQIYKRSLKLVWLLALPAYVAAFLTAVVFFRLWLRTSYVENMPTAFRVMLFGSFLSCLAVAPYFTLMGFGRVRHIFVCHLLKAIVSLSLVIIAVTLLPSLDVTIVCLATVMGHGVSLLYLVIQKRRLFKAICFSMESDR